MEKEQADEWNRTESPEREVQDNELLFGKRTKKISGQVGLCNFLRNSW